MTDKKELLVKRDYEGWFTIQYDGGGQVPEVLKGIYTKTAYAQRAIDSYLKERDREKREYRKSKGAKDNGKVKTTTD